MLPARKQKHMCACVRRWAWEWGARRVSGGEGESVRSAGGSAAVCFWRRSPRPAASLGGLPYNLRGPCPGKPPPALRDASLIRYPAFYCVGLCVRPAAETPGGQFIVLPRTRRSSPVAAPPKGEQRPERLAQSFAPLKSRRNFLNSGGSRFWWAVVCAKARAAAGASLL